MGDAAALLLLGAALLHGVAMLGAICSTWRRVPFLTAAILNALLCVAASVCGGLFVPQAQDMTVLCPAPVTVKLHGPVGVSPCAHGSGYTALVLGCWASGVHAWLIYTGRADAKVKVMRPR